MNRYLNWNRLKNIFGMAQNITAKITPDFSLFAHSIFVRHNYDNSVACLQPLRLNKNNIFIVLTKIA